MVLYIVMLKSHTLASYNVWCSDKKTSPAASCKGQKKQEIQWGSKGLHFQFELKSINLIRWTKSVLIYKWQFN